MYDRGETGGSNVAVSVQVPTAVKDGIWIATFMDAELIKVLPSFQLAFSNIFIGAEIPRLIEYYSQFATQGPIPDLGFA